MVSCKKIYIELRYFIKNRVPTVLKDIQVSLVNPRCHPSSLNLWLRPLAVTQKGMLRKPTHTYLSVIISYFFRKEAQFIEDSVHWRLPGQGYILNILSFVYFISFCFIIFPELYKPASWPQSLILFVYKEENSVIKRNTIHAFCVSQSRGVNLNTETSPPNPDCGSPYIELTSAWIHVCITFQQLWENNPVSVSQVDFQSLQVRLFMI